MQLNGLKSTWVKKFMKILLVGDVMLGRLVNEVLLSFNRWPTWMWANAEMVYYLQKIDPQAVESAKKAYRCFEPFAEDVEHYAITTAFVPGSCEKEVAKMLYFQ